MFDNLTYNPDVRRQKAADQKDAAKTRDIYRETLTQLQTNIQTDSASGGITPEGATLMQGVVDTGMTWLQQHPSALSDSIDAQSQITMDSMTAQINADKILIVFYNSSFIFSFIFDLKIFQRIFLAYRDSSHTFKEFSFYKN